MIIMLVIQTMASFHIRFDKMEQRERERWFCKWEKRTERFFSAFLKSVSNGCVHGRVCVCVCDFLHLLFEMNVIA